MKDFFHWLLKDGDSLLCLGQRMEVDAGGAVEDVSRVEMVVDVFKVELV